MTEIIPIWVIVKIGRKYIATSNRKMNFETDPFSSNRLLHMIILEISYG